MPEHGRHLRAHQPREQRAAGRLVHRGEPCGEAVVNAMSRTGAYLSQLTQQRTRPSRREDRDVAGPVRVDDGDGRLAALDGGAEFLKGFDARERSQSTQFELRGLLLTGRHAGAGPRSPRD